MNNQRLRNLTTGLLHTPIENVYEDIEILTGERGIMTHMIPRACRAMEPWLRERVKDARFWDGAFDQQHIGETDIAPMTDQEREEFFRAYDELPNPLARFM